MQRDRAMRSILSMELVMAILRPVAELSREELIAKIEAMQSTQHKALSLKVSDKGAISVYGMGRFPVTLYRGQMERLLGHADAIRAFIEANTSLLSVKE